MLYIHHLKDLTPKSSEIESTFIIRELKKATPLPLTEEKIRKYLHLFFISESEKEFMERALEQLEPALGDIKAIMDLNDPDFEKVNLMRATKMLEEIPGPLLTNLNYARQVSQWQEEFVAGFVPLFNSLPHLRSDQEKYDVNVKLNKIFHILLRNDVMAFNYRDLINEAHTTRMNDLSESIHRGFLFKIFLEEELRKLDFEIIKRRIPDTKLKAADDVRIKVAQIKKGVDAAYEVNLRMVNWALTIYAYIKWIKESH